MKKGAKDAIIQLLKEREYSPRDIHRVLGVSLPLIHKHLKELCIDGVIERIGNAPYVHYRFIADPEPETEATIASPIVKKYFMSRDFSGNVYYGAEAFLRWSRDNPKKYPLEEKVRLYEHRVRELQDAQGKSGTIPLKGKMEEFHSQTGEAIHLRSMVCVAPYAFPDFGRTKESILLEIAKEGGSRSRGIC